MLTREWRRRLENWRNELRNRFYTKLGGLGLEGFVTLDRLSPEEAQTRTFRPMPPGTRWGAKWEYGWFRGRLVLPEEAAGRRVVLRLDVGADALVFVNGRAAGGMDRQHPELVLSRAAAAGERYEILLEAYAGHGPTPCSVGPTPPGRVVVPEPPATQREVSESSFGVWEEELYQLWLDVETLLQVRDGLDQNSLRVAEIDAGLRDFTIVLDLELPHEAMLETARAARARLEPLLACRNGSTAPELFAFGHGHIDVAWLWPLQESDRKAARTLSTQLALMEEYPEHRFLQSQAYLWQTVKTHYPELYERLRAAVRERRMVADGGMWVEADTNIPAGESLIRQILHGKRFFKEELGTESELLWLPDCFGYSAALPQIMRGCGLKYFSTAKIFWNYHGGDPFPLNTFWWVGLDGSEVLVHLCNDYNSHTSPASAIQRWNERVQKDGISTRLFPFGFGDGGGGPMRDHLEFARRERDLEGVPKVRLAAPIEFFRDLERRGPPDARYVGELYYQAHRGVHTSQARMKRLCRRAELALREAELWGAAARSLAGLEYPAAEMDRTWKKLLTNQFHDILPGSSIRRVYEEAEASLESVVASARAVAEASARRLAPSGGGLAVFNSLSWPRTELVGLPAGATGAVDASGRPLPVQVVEGRAFAEVALPACGWTTVRVASGGRIAGGASASGRTLENEHLRVELDEKGEIASLYDKDASRELAASPMNSLRMYKDVPSEFDAWDVDSMYELAPVELPTAASVELVAAGPLAAILRVKRALGSSSMTQDVVLRRGSRRVEFRTVVEWRESHKLLKACFPTDIRCEDAIHEIQFGHVRRPNHRSRPFDADRFEVVNHRWTAVAEENRGLAVLNDCKYGVNVLGGSINLTLLRAPLAPDMLADRGRHEFAYALYAWNGPFASSGVVREAYELNCPVLAVEGSGGEKSLFSVDAENVVLETVKPVEDRSRDVVVRLYESMRSATRCAVSTALPFSSVWEADMLENARRELRAEGGRIALEFRPFEIKTLRFVP